MDDYIHLYMVYYKKDTDFSPDHDLTFEKVTKGGKYVFVMTQLAKSLEEVFTQMQGERWSPNGEARDYIQSLDLDHTSMSTGDVILDVYTNRMYQCDNIGWKEVYRTQ